MSIDMSQFYQVFFDEAAEHLATMESLLLQLDCGAPDMEDLNAIFRAAHSIKGGSGTFGFTDMTQVTHQLETLLDQLRNSERKPTPPMIDLFLKAGDVLQAQLAAHRGDGKANQEDARAVCELLNKLAATDPKDEVSPVLSTASPASAEPAGSATSTLDITFTSSSGMADIESLLLEIGKLGQLDIIQKPTIKKGRKKSNNKQQWCLRLTTAVAAAEVSDLFGFVADANELTIQLMPPEQRPTAGETTPLGAADTDQGFGLFDEGIPPLVDAATLDNNSYGFFQDAPSAPAVNADGGMVASEAEFKRSPGRRESDNPNIDAIPCGRRDNDKVAVSAASEASSIRVGVGKVDQLINLVGELVITQAMLAQTASQVDPVIYEKLLGSMSTLERNTRDLQGSVMSIRMMPINFVFSRFPRVVRDLASKLDKQVELKTVGEGTELDKGLIEKIADPLTHLVRNSLDHGIELPDIRVAAGKPAKGTITLRAFHQGGNIIIEVSDDGAGLNREKILAKAKQRGLVVPDGMPDQEVWQLIFEAGFSTAEVVTDVSGRGVGMDVVKRNIQAMDGRVEIESVLGLGTRISIRLPLTLAILDGLSVSVGEELFIVPLTYIVESLQPAVADIKTVSGHERVVQVRGEYLPVIALHRVFNLKPKQTEVHQGIVVILEAEGRKTAMFVDALVGQHQVVIKSMESNYRRIPGISGATIMGDGRVALILDATAITRAGMEADSRCQVSEVVRQAVAQVQ